ncbi:MAG: hypothetical protein IOD12_01425, partial [Silvanigrellales bacterium]|nr:hypothetical protein [Silvanigrellales bacterium]
PRAEVPAGELPPAPEHLGAVAPGTTQGARSAAASSRDAKGELPEESFSADDAADMNFELPPLPGELVPTAGGSDAKPAAGGRSP